MLCGRNHLQAVVAATRLLCCCARMASLLTLITILIKPYFPFRYGHTLRKSRSPCTGTKQVHLARVWIVHAVSGFPNAVDNSMCRHASASHPSIRKRHHAQSKVSPYTCRFKEETYIRLQKDELEIVRTLRLPELFCAGLSSFRVWRFCLHHESHVSYNSQTSNKQILDNSSTFSPANTHAFLT